MMLIFGLMLLLQTAACLELNCSFGQSDPCYAALGDKLNLLMERDASKYDLRIQKRIYNTQYDPVCRVKNGSKKECDLYNNRPEVNIINGTVIINRVIRADSGNYRLTLTDSDGTDTTRDLQVIVEGPSVALIVLGCFTVILIILVAISYYIYKKKNRLETTANVENTSTDAQTNRNEKEQELHYGEITFSSSNVKQQPSKTQEKCRFLGA
ncbi:si:zfos-741a10.3 [Cyprinus carpio]|uniref:Si:zfos-741a10.3 n=1 Tax=Cyprinus carpio TaxID=7962 RepID=A0A9R0B8L4_CYPCA|nr:si:zfos-741a10.3 [Cyprinus carpio]